VLKAHPRLQRDDQQEEAKAISTHLSAKLQGKNLDADTKASVLKEHPRLQRDDPQEEAKAIITHLVEAPSQTIGERSRAARAVCRSR